MNNMDCDVTSYIWMSKIRVNMIFFYSHLKLSTFRILFNNKTETNSKDEKIDNFLNQSLKTKDSSNLGV